MVQLEVAIQLHVCLVKLAGGAADSCTISPDDVSSLIFAAVVVTPDLTRDTAKWAASVFSGVGISGALPCLRSLAAAGRFFVMRLPEPGSKPIRESRPRCAIM
jgi:hypothetical protein